MWREESLGSRVVTFGRLPEDLVKSHNLEHVSHVCAFLGTCSPLAVFQSSRVCLLQLENSFWYSSTHIRIFCSLYLFYRLYQNVAVRSAIEESMDNARSGRDGFRCYSIVQLEQTIVSISLSYQGDRVDTSLMNEAQPRSNPLVSRFARRICRGVSCDRDRMTVYRSYCGGVLICGWVG